MKNKNKLTKRDIADVLEESGKRSLITTAVITTLYLGAAKILRATDKEVE